MSGARRFWGRIRAARDGVSAVEFALIAPVILFLYLATAEASQAFMAHRRVAQVATVLGDLI